MTTYINLNTILKIAVFLISMNHLMTAHAAQSCELLLFDGSKMSRSNTAESAPQGATPIRPEIAQRLWKIKTESVQRRVTDVEDLLFENILRLNKSELVFMQYVLDSVIADWREPAKPTGEPGQLAHRLDGFLLLSKQELSKNTERLIKKIEMLLQYEQLFDSEGNPSSNYTTLAQALTGLGRTGFGSYYDRQNRRARITQLLSNTAQQPNQQWNRQEQDVLNILLQLVQ